MINIRGRRIGVSRVAMLVLGVIATIASTIQVVGQDSQPSNLGNAGKIVGAPAGTALSGDALERRTIEVAGLLRCPVCQGLSVADSHAAMAINMKNEVRELLSRGFSETQILDYFEASYGEFVRLEPEKKGFNYIVWLAPALLLLLGGGVISLVLKSQRRRSKTAAAPAPIADALVIAPELQPWILRVRDVAYGAPGGESSAALEEKA